MERNYRNIARSNFGYTACGLASISFWGSQIRASATDRERVTDRMHTRAYVKVPCLPYTSLPDLDLSIQRYCSSLKRNCGVIKLILNRNI